MLSYLPWLISGGAIVWVALALLAPGILSIITPFVKYALDAFAEYVRTLWEGFKYVFDRSSAVVFLLSAVVLSYWYGHVGAPPKYKMTKKTPHAIESPTKSTSKRTFTEDFMSGWTR